HLRRAVVAHEVALDHPGADVGEPVARGKDPEIARDELVQKVDLHSIPEARDVPIVDPERADPVLVSPLAEVVGPDRLRDAAEGAVGADDDARAKTVLAPVFVRDDDPPNVPVVLLESVESHPLDRGHVGLPASMLKEHVVEDLAWNDIARSGQ